MKEKEMNCGTEKLRLVWKLLQLTLILIVHSWFIFHCSQLWSGSKPPYAAELQCSKN